MTPLLDQIVTSLLIAGALAFFLLRFLRRGKKGCDTGCGCTASSKLPSPPAQRKP